MARPIPSARPSWYSPPNPVDYEGTFPLPLRQLDRFLMRIHIANSRPKTNARYCASPPQTTTASPSTRYPVATHPEISAPQEPATPIFVEADVLDFLLQTITASHTKIKFKAGASVRGGCRRRRRSTRSRHADHRLRHLDRLLSSGFSSSLSMREESLCRRQGDSTIRADTRTTFSRVQLAWHGASRSPAETTGRAPSPRFSPLLVI